MAFTILSLIHFGDIALSVVDFTTPITVLLALVDLGAGIISEVGIDSEVLIITMLPMSYL
ncbi:MAG: hypothetical protein COW40_00790 [Cytophagales bacterium CG17_big_fil_post_rev_8_21_14_2_50_40_13]|nr:MAG: hypothetical protein COW40_00790 [Cytophagales bacterium CG17_big_fil_post_rev_8_21_14_2_50_40_13]